MTTTQAVQGLLTLRDVAELCRVERPVVSMWRKRTSVDGMYFPFPRPSAQDRATELFDAESVLQWLEGTGRGNNPEARLDAAAFIRPPSLRASEPLSDSSVMALLCLGALTDRRLSDLNADELLDLADEFDPDNEALYTEVELLGTDRLQAGRYVDDLVEAAYGVSGAAAAFKGRQIRSRGQEARSMLLAPEAHQLTAQLVTELALDLGASAVIVSDATKGEGELAHGAAVALAQKLECALAIAGDGSAARAGRRGAMIGGIALKASVEPDEPAVVVAQLPHPGDPKMTPSQMLTAIDDIQLGLGVGQRAVIVGPAAVLCNRLVDQDLERHRDELIRGLGRLRAAVRLPEGLVVGRSRQRLGLWILGPQPSGSREERWVAVADLAGRPLTPAVTSDLVTDVVTVMAPVRTGTMHAFHFAAVTSTTTLLSRGGDLVSAGAGPRGPHDAGVAHAVLTAEAVLSSLESQASRLGGEKLVASPAMERSTLAPEALGSLVDDKRVCRVSGTRMAEVTASPSGGVRILGAEDVFTRGETAAVYVDPLALESAYTLARRTEPGDVVFVLSPRPAAIVDREGLSVVRFPAMVLRCAEGSGVWPEVLAATINAQRDAARSWRAWIVPRIASERGQGLNDALCSVNEERSLLCERLQMLDELTAVLIDGAAKGAITITRSTDTHTKGDPS